jgi:hypothetical protein
MKFHTRHISTHLFPWMIVILLVSSCTFKIERLDQPIATIPPPATLSVITDTPAPLPTMEVISTPTTQTTVGVSLGECLLWKKNAR